MLRNNADYIASLGGDELAVHMVDIHSENSVIEKCREICKNIQLGYKQDKGIEISCSLGISITHMHGKTSEEMYKNADAAMYKAKRNGINQWQLAEK